MTFEEKISTITTIPTRKIKYLSDCVKHIHSHDLVTQNIEANNPIYTIQLFEGELLIKVEDDEIEYKFIPNEKFENIIRDSILSNKSSLTEAMKEKLKAILTSAYKDVL